MAREVHLEEASVHTGSEDWKKLVLLSAMVPGLVGHVISKVCALASRCGRDQQETAGPCSDQPGIETSSGTWGFPSGAGVENPPAMQETQVRSLDRRSPEQAQQPSPVF